MNSTEPAPTSLLPFGSSARNQIIAYALLGVCVNLIYGALFLSVVWLSPTSRVAASTLAYVVACLFQYVANARLTFGRRALDSAQAVRYGAAVLLGYALSTVSLGWVAPRLSVPDVLAILFVAACLAVLNYIIFSKWVYCSAAATLIGQKLRG